MIIFWLNNIKDQLLAIQVNFMHNNFRPRPVEERPKWLDDPRGAYGRPDVLPKDFPRGVGESGGMRIQ